MIIEQIWTGNAYRNFNYLIVCPQSGVALAIDPLDHEKCLAVARDEGWAITQILNTHEHEDHTGGNRPMIEATGAKLLAHHGAGHTIEGIDRGLEAGDVVKVGMTVELEALDTPGHTMSHVCLLSHTDDPALICGDTLFNAGAGNCHGGGHPAELYETFAAQLARLPDETRVYPGHDYWTEQPRVHPRPRAGQREGEGVARRHVEPRPGERTGVDSRAREGSQRLLPTALPEHHREAARGIPGPARRAGSQDGVRQAAGAAQRLVRPAPPSLAAVPARNGSPTQSGAGRRLAGGAAFVTPPDLRRGINRRGRTSAGR